MRSATLERADVGHASDVPMTLLVLWGDPVSRSIVPVARMDRTEEGFDFGYIKAVDQHPDFRPFLGLDDLDAIVSVSDTNWPGVISQRLMSPHRPDFREYMGSLGLDASSSTPWEQIIRSGGARVGDTLQFMPIPTVDEDGFASAVFFVNGIRHVKSKAVKINGVWREPDDARHEAALRSLRAGSELRLVPESENETDASAQLVVSGRGVPLGYVPQVLSEPLTRLQSRVGRLLSATVARTLDRNHPAHVRLVCEVHCQGADGFSFDPTGAWDYRAV